MAKANHGPYKVEMTNNRGERNLPLLSMSQIGISSLLERVKGEVGI